MALRDALKKVGDAIQDLSSLNVQTYTGSVEIDMDSIPAGKEGIEHVRDVVKEARGSGAGDARRRRRGRPENASGACRTGEGRL